MSGDEQMKNAYKQGKDLYATIASGIYKMDYWDCMEKHEDGSPNPDGKKRRSSVKGLLLGIMYGMGAQSIAITIKGTLEEAQKIIDDFYKSFPKVKTWIDQTQKDARKNLYVEDFYGRRRRLKDLGLPPFTIRYKDKSMEAQNSDFNPILHCKGIITNTKSPVIEEYKKKVEKCTFRNQVQSLKYEADKDGIEILDNGGYIARAERQCVNARIQGGAATMSKIAMRKVYDSQELRDLGFSIILQIHDELIGECPEENADRVAEILCDIMKNSVADYVDVPFKCDPDISPCWYYSDYSDTIRKEYNEMTSGGKSPEEAFNFFIENNSECTVEQLREMIYN
jgi:DNA polymerase I-like protein with 3'-5' exonuclease and polymerase domains